MQYLGGKSRLAGRISAALLADTAARAKLIEPMTGGGSMLAKLAPHFSEVEAGDLQQDLVLMWQAIQQGWDPPHSVSESEWRQLRDAEPSPLRAFAGFGCSFGGRFFEGYARGIATSPNFAAQAARRLAPIADILRARPIHFRRSDYEDWDVAPGDVVYLDPPYAGTKPYSSTRSGIGRFDHERFWTTAERWRDIGAHVYVSEFTAPDGWRVVWEQQRTTGVGGRNPNRAVRTDRLFA